MILRKLKKFFSRRAVMISLIVVAELLLLCALTFLCSRRLPGVGLLLRFGTVAAAIYLISRSHNPAYKLAWLTVMLILPESGGLIWLFGGNKRLPRKLKRRLAAFEEKRPSSLPYVADSDRDLSHASADFWRIASYLERCCGFPAWGSTECEFFPVGDLLFDRLCKCIEDARRFIFIEYFIIAEGVLWEKIEPLLIQKSQSGVTVRIMYDDLGCIDVLPRDFKKRLSEAGVEVTVFNRCRPHLYSVMNYRDHRKICVIDGHIGFCGGANIADEYINRLPRCGHWKDTGVMLRGEGVYGLTLLFLNLWDFSNGTSSDPVEFAPRESRRAEGFVQPFGDSPLDDICVTESVCLMSILRAKKYIYITSPYLILDSEMIKALTAAALSGVDVRIITPGVPDKWYVHAVSRSFYPELLRCGVRIFEYTPGFIHSKQLVCDDGFAMVGTANMDFRSFYLHFESAVCLYGGPAVSQVRLDIERTLDCCREMMPEDIRALPFIERLTATVLRPFSPLF